MTPLSHQLTLSWDQLCIVSRASETLPRANMGQIDIVLEQVPSFFESADARRLFYDELLVISNMLTGYQGHGYHGIHHPVIPESARQAWDIHQVVRVAILETRSDASSNTGIDRVRFPLSASKTDPLPEVVPITQDDGRPAWQLSLTPGHIDSLELASQLFARLQRGELKILQDHVCPQDGYKPSANDVFYVLEQLEVVAKTLFGDDAPLSITPAVETPGSKSGKVAWDIWRALQMRNALLAPGVGLSGEPLPAIKMIEDPLPAPRT